MIRRLATHFWRSLPAATVFALHLIAVPSLVHANDRMIAGIATPGQVQLADRFLALNGAGIRFRGPFQVYVAALYGGRKATELDDLMADPGPKRLKLVMLREIDSADLGRLFINGIQKNMSASEGRQVLMDLPRMGELFARHKRLQPGEDVTMDWIPASGLQISVKGVPQGEPIRSPAFFKALLSIWLGPDPADPQLKMALLGNNRPVAERGRR